MNMKLKQYEKIAGHAGLPSLDLGYFILRLTCTYTSEIIYTIHLIDKRLKSYRFL